MGTLGAIGAGLGEGIAQGGNTIRDIALAQAHQKWQSAENQKRLDLEQQRITNEADYRKMLMDWHAGELERQKQQTASNIAKERSTEFNAPINAMMTREPRLAGELGKASALSGQYIDPTTPDVTMPGAPGVSRPGRDELLQRRGDILASAAERADQIAAERYRQQYGLKTAGITAQEAIHEMRRQYDDRAQFKRALSTDIAMGRHRVTTGQAPEQYVEDMANRFFGPMGGIGSGQRPDLPIPTGSTFAPPGQPEMQFSAQPGQSPFDAVSQGMQGMGAPQVGAERVAADTVRGMPVEKPGMGDVQMTNAPPSQYVSPPSTLNMPGQPSRPFQPLGRPNTAAQFGQLESLNQATSFVDSLSKAAQDPRFAYTGWGAQTLQDVTKGAPPAVNDFLKNTFGVTPPEEKAGSYSALLQNNLQTLRTFFKGRISNFDVEYVGNLTPQIGENNRVIRNKLNKLSAIAHMMLDSAQQYMQAYGLNDISQIPEGALTLPPDKLMGLVGPAGMIGGGAPPAAGQGAFPPSFQLNFGR